jgi:uncharacterized protein (TIGR00299 family) protein
VRGLIIDPFAGISGDMLLGALVDLGLPVASLQRLVDSMGLAVTVDAERVNRSGIACWKVAFGVPESDAVRHLPDVLQLIDESAAAGNVKGRAASVFRRLAEVEAEVHGVPVEKVHFHEVGALDSILDVLCGVAGIHELGYERCYVRPIAVGSGSAPMGHGVYPLPAPATARLLAGLPVRETGYPEECTTPTGAALAAELTGGTSPPSDVVYGSSGFGAGSRDPAGRPNCLRLIECRIPVLAGAEGPEPGASVYALQADIDDLSPEYVAAAREALIAAGSLDVALVRIDMKKGRPGLRLEALAPEAALQNVIEAFFRGTSTIGVRYWRVDRAVLGRAEETLRWRGHRIRVKRATLPDGTVRRKPEYEDVAAAARAEGVTPYEVRVELEEEGLDGSGS